MTQAEALVELPVRGEATQTTDQLLRQAFVDHARYIARVVFRTMGDDSDLDDVVQQTFVDAAESLGELRSPASIRAWLVTVAVRNAKRAIARRSRTRFFDWVQYLLSPQSSDPSSALEAHALYDALMKLSEGLRTPWVLHHVEGFTLPEVAVQCDTSLATVKRRIAEAANHLARRSSHG